MPLLSALDPSTKGKADIVYEKSNPEIESRSFLGFNGFFGPNYLFNNDYTRENSSNTNELDNKIRIASLGLAIRNIFNDIIVRRINGFIRFLKLATKYKCLD